MEGDVKRILRIAILTIVAVICFEATAFANTKDTATRIKADSSYRSCSFTSGGDLEAWYAFSLDGPGLLKITTIDNTCKNLSWYLTDAGVPGTDSFFASSTITAAAAGTEVNLSSGSYLLKYKISKGNEGSFQFALTFTSAYSSYSQPNNALSQVKNLPALGVNGLITGYFAVNDHMDYYKFNVTESGRFSVEWKDIFYCGLTLYDEAENSLAGKFYHVPGVVDTGETLSVDLAPGIYYLKFSDQSSPRHKGTYQFYVKFEPSGETYTMENNSIEEAKRMLPVNLNETVKGQLAVNDIYDYYKIYIPRTGSYNLTVNADHRYYAHTETSVPFNVQCLLTSGGSPFRAEYSNRDKSDPPQVSFIYKNLKKGTYYLYFRDNWINTGKVTGPYSFIMKPAPVTCYKPKAGKKSFTAKWQKGTGSGYQIQYALNKKFTKSKKTVTVSKAKTTSKVIKKLKAKKTYYVRIRSYVKYKGKKYYSDWSTYVGKVKTKK